MALFKIFRGTSNRLPQTITDGYAYFTTDDGNFYIDAEVNGELTRTCINPNSNWLAEGSGKDVIYNKPSQMTLEEVRGGHSTTPRLISPALLKALLDEKVSEIDIPPELIYPSNIKPLMNGAADAGTSMKYSRGDHVHPSDTSRAPVKSPNFTGFPTAPTAAAGSNTSQIATTAFVSTAVAAAISRQVTYTLSRDEDNIILIGSDGSISQVKDSQNILWFDEYSDFPIGGKIDKIYIDKSLGDIYYWNGSSYQKISSSGGGGGSEVITVEIDSSAGNIFISRNISTTLTCIVKRGNEDITNQVQSFKWIRKDQHGVIDQSWTKITTRNTITITPDDVFCKAIFMCEVTLI